MRSFVIVMDLAISGLVAVATFVGAWALSRIFSNVAQSLPEDWKESLDQSGRYLFKGKFGFADIFSYSMTLGTILAIIAFLLSDSLLTGPIIIFITLGIPLALAAQRTAKYRKALEEVLPSALQQVANEMASGSSLEKALEAAAQSAPTPADIELGALQRKVAALGMERALEETAEKLQINSFSLAASVLTVGTNQGGNLIHALKRLSTTLVEIQRLNRKIRTASEIGRRVMLFLTIAYVGFSLGWYTLGPQEFSDVIRHPIGNGMFIGSFLTWAVGIIWALKAMRVKV